MRLGWILGMTVILGVLGMQGCFADIGLVKGGVSDYTIVLSKNASPSERHAAGELQRFLCEVSKAKLPIVTEGKTLPKHMIVLGDGAALKALGVEVDFENLGDEGFAIKTAGPHLVIAGGKLRGTMYGVYTFLEEQIGCRWYTSKVSYIPKKSSITVRELNIVEKPDFEYREPNYVDSNDPDWSARNKCNSTGARLDEARGGKVEYHHFVHTFGDLVPLAKYWDTHPEYFSMKDGKRTRDLTQLCMTNPDVIKAGTETVMKWIEERPNAKIYSVSQNDWYNNCQCDNCKAVDAEEGSPSGLMLRFVNAIAAEVEKKYPDKLIDTLAYQWTENPPKITKPRANVRVRLCPIFCCESHPYEQCEVNAGFVSNLKNWNKVTNNLYIWHYNTNFHNYIIPFPDLVELPDSVRMYKRTGVKGIFAEGNYSSAGGYMDELKAYLLSKMLWDCDTDPNAVMADFLVGYYGKAAGPMGEFLRTLQKKVRDEHIHVHIWSDVNSPYLSPEIMAKSEELFDKAERLAENPDVLERVRHTRLSLEYVKIVREAGSVGASGTPEQKAATLKKLESFIQECEADGIGQLNEGCPIRTRFAQMSEPLKK